MKLIRRRNSSPPHTLGNWKTTKNSHDFICDKGLRRFFYIPQGVKEVHLMVSSKAKRPTREALKVKRMTFGPLGDQPRLRFDDGRGVLLLNNFADWLKERNVKWIWFEYDG
jgi:hypothetical protein